MELWIATGNKGKSETLDKDNLYSSNFPLFPVAIQSSIEFLF